MLYSNKPGKYTYYEISSKGKEFIVRVLSLETIFSLLAALLTLFVLGDDWTLMILDQTSFTSNELANCIYSLSIVYLILILIVAALYPFCKIYRRYKLGHPEKWWLSYL